jgi:acyl carrier protein
MSGNCGRASNDAQVTTIDRLRRVFIQALRLNLRDEEVPYDRLLDEIAGFDSIAVLEFVAAVEREFDITIEEDALHLNLLRDLRRFSEYLDSQLTVRARE